jgi:hypothetical protein
MATKKHLALDDLHKKALVAERRIALLLNEVKRDALNFDDGEDERWIDLSRLGKQQIDLYAQIKELDPSFTYAEITVENPEDLKAVSWRYEAQALSNDADDLREQLKRRDDEKKRVEAELAERDDTVDGLKLRLEQREAALEVERKRLAHELEIRLLHEAALEKADLLVLAKERAEVERLELELAAEEKRRASKETKQHSSEQVRPKDGPNYRRV